MDEHVMGGCACASPITLGHANRRPADEAKKYLLILGTFVGWSPVASVRRGPAHASASPVLLPAREPSATASDGAGTPCARTCTPAVHLLYRPVHLLYTCCTDPWCTGPLPPAVRQSVGHRQLSQSVRSGQFGGNWPEPWVIPT